VRTSVRASADPGAAQTDGIGSEGAALESMAAILTVSSFMSRGNRRAELLAALSSLLSKHTEDELSLLREIVVINEYDDDRQEDFAPEVRACWPRVEFVQKGAEDRGQARTLNTILDRLAGYDWWIHWEESWVCTRPFVAGAIDVMRATDLTQLQVARGWLDVGADRLRPGRTPDGTPFVRVLPHPHTADLVRRTPVSGYGDLVARVGMAVGWPLYSLQPGVNRARFCRALGRFDESPPLWPIRFEWEYAKRWLLAGGTKGVSVPPAAERQANHVSTYE
jgi:hypothetical protein